MSPDIEQPVDDLAAIADEAATVEAGAAAALIPDEAAPPVITASSSAEWRQAVAFGCGIIIAMRPELSDEWTSARLDALGDALATCGAHYGWNIEKLLGNPLLALALAAFPLLVGLIKVEKARAAEKVLQPITQE